MYGTVVLGVPGFAGGVASASARLLRVLRKAEKSLACVSEPREGTPAARRRFSGAFTITSTAGKNPVARSFFPVYADCVDITCRSACFVRETWRFCFYFELVWGSHALLRRPIDSPWLCGWTWPSANFSQLRIAATSSALTLHTFPEA